MQARLERVAADFDARHLNRVPNVDFDGYLNERYAAKDKVKMATEYRDLMLSKMNDANPEVVYLLPWKKLSDVFQFRPGEVTTWVGFNGHYKSMLTGYVALDLIRQGAKICIASFEMKPLSSLVRMSRQAIGIKNPTLEYLDKFFAFTDPTLWFYDHQGPADAARVIAMIYYCAEQLHITQFVVDSLMKCVKGEDDMNGQKDFVDRLCAAARELNVHIHLIHHSRKREDETKRPGKQDAKGSGSIVDQTDNFFVVYRTPENQKEKNPDLPDVMLYCDKQRNGEWEGRIGLWLDQESLQFREYKSTRAINFV